MTNYKTRLEKLEGNEGDRSSSKIEYIELHKTYEDGREEVELWQVNRQLDEDGYPIVSAWLPANSRDNYDDQIKTVQFETVTTETDEQPTNHSSA